MKNLLMTKSVKTMLSGWSESRDPIKTFSYSLRIISLTSDNHRSDCLNEAAWYVTCLVFSKTVWN